MIVGTSNDPRGGLNLWQSPTGITVLGSNAQKRRNQKGN
nr:MAG TPA: hypothetical protein [Bacteriophage sp.]